VSRATPGRLPRLLTLIVIGSLLPAVALADHPRAVRTKKFVHVEVVAPPHAPVWYVDVLTRLVDKRLEDRPLPQPASALLEIGRNGQIQTLSLIATTGDEALDQALLWTIRQAAPLPALTDAGNFRCIIRWSSP
jgi:hypothetical protein